MQEQATVDLEGTPVSFRSQGRHDPCVLPRAVAIVESMAAMVILDNILFLQSEKTIHFTQ